MIEPSQPSPHGDIVVASDAPAVTEAAKSIYRIDPHSEVIACENCNLRGDKWDMQVHICKGSRI